MAQTIELIYFDGCPCVDDARANLQQALQAARLPAQWTEWEQNDPAAPARVKQYGSPTVLVNGRNVTGDEEGVDASACCADGAPALETIQAALAQIA